MEVSGYSKIYQLGHRECKAMQGHELVVQEKIDGSQFSAQVVDGVLYCRSHHKQIVIDAPEKMFKGAVETFQRLHLGGKLREGWVYRGECLCKPKHNALAYGRKPVGDVILFDIEMSMHDMLAPDHVAYEAGLLGLECVPTFAKVGSIPPLDLINRWLEKESCLGGQKIEGVVVKCYDLSDSTGHVLMGKYVSEAFKEVHRESWGESNPSGKDIIGRLIDSYTTTARFDKAVIHLKELGLLAGEPKDIGLLINEVKADITEECGEEIARTLANHFMPHITRGITSKIPQWYKDKLVEQDNG